MLPKRSMIHRIYAVIQISIAEARVPEEHGDDLLFVATGRTLGNWAQFMDLSGVFWATLDDNDALGYRALAYDSYETIDHEWQLEELWEHLFGSSQTLTKELGKWMEEGGGI